MVTVVNKIGEFKSTLGNFSSLSKALNFIGEEFTNKLNSPFCCVEVETKDRIITLEELRSMLKGRFVQCG